jgi:hypothetical protein
MATRILFLVNSTSRSRPLTPADLAERERENKERKAREDAEQAQLPYKWTQTIRVYGVILRVWGRWTYLDEGLLTLDGDADFVLGQHARTKSAKPVRMRNKLSSPTNGHRPFAMWM